jgi:hypothetical protein
MIFGALEVVANDRRRMTCWFTRGEATDKARATFLSRANRDNILQLLSKLKEYFLSIF